MADEPRPEGWHVPQRPAVIAAALVPLGLAVALVATGYLYDHRLRPQRRAPVTTFPAPGVETYVHDGALDPHRPRAPTPPDPALAAAKQAVARDGLPGWRR